MATVVFGPNTKGLIFPIRTMGYNVSGHLFVLWEKFSEPFIISDHVAMLHPSSCQHPNVLDLCSLSPERKVTQTKLLVAFTTCQILNLSRTSPFFSVTTILRRFVDSEWQEIVWTEQYMCVEFMSLLVNNTPNAVVLEDRLIPPLFQ